MLTVTSIDLSGLDIVLRGIQNALIGVGEDGDASKLTKQTAKLLAKDIADRMPPKNRATQARSIKRDIGSVFEPKPSPFFPSSKQGSGNILWMYAGPTFVKGVKREDYRPEQTNVDTLSRLMRKERQRGKRSVDLGKIRTGQHAMLSQRIIIKRDAYANLALYLQGRSGRMKASFYKTYVAMGGEKVAAWIARHLNTAPGSVKNELSNSASPSVTMESHAIGIGKMEWAITAALKHRTEAMYKRLELILTGYAKDVATTGRVRRHA